MRGSRRTRRPGDGGAVILRRRGERRLTVGVLERRRRCSRGPADGGFGVDDQKKRQTSTRSATWFKEAAADVVTAAPTSPPKWGLERWW
jgi:hypothetical protein